jgi:hypothetical protein
MSFTTAFDRAKVFSVLVPPPTCLPFTVAAGSAGTLRTANAAAAVAVAFAANAGARQEALLEMEL